MNGRLTVITQPPKSLGWAQMLDGSARTDGRYWVFATTQAPEDSIFKIQRWLLEFES